MQVVLDEADTMFDRGFGPEVRAVLAPLRSKAAPARVVLVCATLTPARALSFGQQCCLPCYLILIQESTLQLRS